MKYVLDTNICIGIINGKESVLRDKMKASKKGDTRPAEWALAHTRAVQPIEKGDSGPRISVQVGIALPGLGMSTQVVDTKALPAVTVSLNEAQPQLEPISADASTAKY